MKARFGLLSKLLRAGPDRPTRLHDGRGNLVSPGRLLRNGPRAAGSGLLRLLLGRWPVRPWFSYDATRAIAEHLTPRSVVLEYGSGRSTLWLARRCAHVYSVEDSPEWHALVQRLLQQHTIANVTYGLRADPASYAGFPEDPTARFDLVIVDGSHRLACVRAALPRLQAGGMLYIDNTDGDLDAAEALVGEQVRQAGGVLQRYTDFAPAQLYVSQGLMYLSPKDSPRYT
jgi:hypothetical protein